MLFISVIGSLVILGLVIYLIVYFENKCKSVGVSQPSGPRVVVPSDGRLFWTFSTTHTPLKEEEYSRIYNAGYEQISCTAEQDHYYANCGPESPRLERTKFNYVFRKKVDA